MKSIRLTIAAAFAFVVLLGSAVAQTGTIRARIPFDFTVGKQTLAAGEYQVTANGAMLQLIRIDGPGAIIEKTHFMRGGSDESLSARLVFRRYGDRHFLAKVWMGNVDFGHEVFASPLEVEYARNTKPEGTIVLASKLAK